MVAINPNISITILSNNDLNTPIKRWTVRWIKKPQLHVAYKKPTLKYKDTYRLRVKE